jgi:hypothetical protein
MQAWLTRPRADRIEADADLAERTSPVPIVEKVRLPIKMNALVRILIIGAVASATALTAAIAAENEGGPPGLQKKGGVPPGLQKKEGLPPGQAKKRGKTGEAETETSVAVTSTTAVPTSTKAPDAPTIPAPPQDTKTATPPEVAKPGAPETPKSAAKPTPQLSKEATEKRERVQKSITELNTIARQPEARDRLLIRLNKHFDIPLAKLQAEEKANPDIGMGGLYIAHGIARKSHQPVDKIMAEHKSGKDWVAIADAHKVSMTELSESVAAAKESAQSTKR